MSTPKNSEDTPIAPHPISAESLQAELRSPADTESLEAIEEIEVVVEVDSKVPFAKTSTAAKLSGTFLETAGFFKRKLGEMTDDSELRTTGRNQELLGKVHRLVGSVREIREITTRKITDKRSEGYQVLRKHGGKALDLTLEFVDDVKKVLFK